jgi:Uma2 family endonuclease
VIGGVGNLWVVTSTDAVVTHRWTRDEYAALAVAGIELRCELIDGDIIDVSPMQVRHAYVTNRLVKLLGRSVDDTLTVGSQTPIVIDEHSEPEPDVWVATVPDVELVVRKPTPEDLALVVEVAETSYLLDRNRKLPLYARSGVSLVWIVDLRRDVVEVHSGPDTGTYRSLMTVGVGDSLELPWGGELAVADFIGPR